MELRQVKKKTTWNDAANVINDNAQIIAQKIVSLEAGRGNQKGYFASLEALQSAYPVAGIGDTAYVGTTYPYAIYKYTESGWVDTGATGGEASNAYTKQETDDKFLSKSGGTINGHLKVQGDILTDTDEHDIGESGRPFNQVYASEFIEAGNSLSAKYATKESLNNFATKEEAYDFVNVGIRNNLQEAINAIPYRVGLQVVTFTNKSTLKRKKISIWFANLQDGNTVSISFGQTEKTSIVIGGSEGICNHSLYDAIISDQRFLSLLYYHSFNESFKTMIFEFKEDEKDVDISYICNNPNVSIYISILQKYNDIQNESYQLKYNTTEDSIFQDVSNWEQYSSKEEEEETWGEW